MFGSTSMLMCMYSCESKIDSVPSFAFACDTRCETFELRDRVSEACEAFIESSPEEDEDEEGGDGDGKEGQDVTGVIYYVVWCDVV